MLEMRHLFHAVALSEHRNFARAAVSLNLSQPALTRSIQAFEGQLGVRLFDRKRKGVEPTEAGHLLLKRARGLIAQAEDLERETGAVSRGIIGETKVAAGPYVAKMLLGSVVGALLREQTGASFRLVVDSWTESARLLREREVDLAVCDVSEIDESVFEVLPLASHQAYCVVREGHPLSPKTRRFSEVRRWPLGVTAIPPRVLGHLNSPRIEDSQPTAVHCEDLEILKEIVTVSDVVMFLPLCLVAEEIRRRTLRVLPLEIPWLKTQFGVIKLKGRTLSSFCDRVTEEVQQADRECHQLGEKLRSEFFAPKHPRRKRTRPASKGTSTKK